MSVSNRANLFEKFASCFRSCGHVVDKAETKFPLLSLLSAQLYQGTCLREYNLCQQIGHAGFLLYSLMLYSRRIGTDVGSPVLWSVLLSVCNRNNETDVSYSTWP